jgi:hypothetical protein
MDANEGQFRQWEHRFDCALSAAQAQLRAVDIRLEDHSVRRRERGEYLRWDHEFTRSRELEIETAQVRLRMSFLEPIEESSVNMVRMWCCAEQFRPGQISRIRQIIDRGVPESALATFNLGDFVIQEVRNAARLINHMI